MNINSAYWVIFLLSVDFFFKINFFEKFFKKYHQSVKQLGSRSPECQTVWIQIRPDVFDLGSNCLQMLSAEDRDVKKKASTLMPSS